MKKEYPYLHPSSCGAVVFQSYPGGRICWRYLLKTPKGISYIGKVGAVRPVKKRAGTQTPLAACFTKAKTPAWPVASAEDGIIVSEHCAPMVQGFRRYRYEKEE